MADKGIRRLRHLHQHDRGAAPVVIYLDGCYGVFALEDILALLGAPVQQTLRPNLRPPVPCPTNSSCCLISTYLGPAARKDRVIHRLDESAGGTRMAAAGHRDCNPG